jgi:nucleoside-triphosphatase THEP1
MIHILSGSVHSGKTSRLLQWAEGRSDLAGIATPEQDGLKMLYDLKARRYFPFQINEPYDPAVDSIGIGSYRFSDAAFLLARQILERAVQHSPGWLIIDEIGPLELAGQGFEPVAGSIISQYSGSDLESNLLLVIRDTILHKAIEHYHITEFRNSTLVPESLSP